jgi:hypothetical protein
MGERVSDRLHTPVNAHLAYFLASIPVILVYNLWGSWTALTLGVTFACGYVFVITALAGALMPYRAKALYDASPARFTRWEISHGDDLRPDRRHRGRHHGADVHVL